MAKGRFPLAVAKIPYEQSNFSLASFPSFPLYPSASSEGRDESLQRQRCEGISTRFLQGPWGSAAPFTGSFYAEGSSAAPRKCQEDGQRTQGTAPGGAGCWPQQVKRGPEGCSWTHRVPRAELDRVPPTAANRSPAAPSAAIPEQQWLQLTR